MALITAGIAGYLVVGALAQRFGPNRNGDEPEPR